MMCRRSNANTIIIGKMLITAPAGGTVVEKMVYQGKYVYRFARPAE